MPISLTFFIAQVCPSVFLLARKTCPNAPYPNFLRISKSLREPELVSMLQQYVIIQNSNKSVLISISNRNKKAMHRRTKNNNPSYGDRIQNNRKTDKKTDRNGKSMLLYSQSQKFLSNVPLDYQKNVKQINISHNRIYKLKGIEKYQSLSRLDVSHNLIENYNELDILNNLRSLKQLSIQQNPISQRINYRYLVLLKIPHLQIIDNLKVHPYSVKQLKKWQHQIGKKLVIFQYQKCQIIQQPQPNQQTFQELKSILKTVNSLQKQKYLEHSIPLLNNLLDDLLPLKSILVAEPPQDHFEQIQQYLLETLIKIGAKQQPYFIDILLSKIEVGNQDEQRIIKNDTLASLLILSKSLKNQFQSNVQFQSAIYDQQKSNQKINIKHFVSADTAMDTNQRIQSNKTNFLHFVMDERYLNILTIFIKKQLQTLNSLINSKFSNSNPISTFQIQNDSNKFAQNSQFEQKSYSQQDSLKEYLPIDNRYHKKHQNLHKTNHPYYNGYILDSLLKVFEKNVYKIIFRKLRCANNMYITPLINQQNQIKQLFTRISHKYQMKSLSDAFQILQNISQQQLIEQIILRREIKKLKKIFYFWKNIRVRKAKLLMKFAKKKTKNDRFLMAITIQKWKMNAGARKLKKMASQVLLRVSHTKKLPVSRKGIEYAYKRVASKYKF